MADSGERPAPHRIQLSRKKGWRRPEGVVVVARPSRWGNPFPVSTYGLDLALDLYGDLVHGIWNPSLLAAFTDAQFAHAYEARRRWIARLNNHPTHAIRFWLAGHDLACWCPLYAPCHADVLLEVANQELSDDR